MRVNQNNPNCLGKKSRLARTHSVIKTVGFVRVPREGEPDRKVGQKENVYGVSWKEGGA